MARQPSRLRRSLVHERGHLHATIGEHRLNTRSELLLLFLSKHRLNTRSELLLLFLLSKHRLNARSELRRILLGDERRCRRLDAGCQLRLLLGEPSSLLHGEFDRYLRLLQGEQDHLRLGLLLGNRRLRLGLLLGDLDRPCSHHHRWLMAREPGRLCSLRPSHYNAMSSGRLLLFCPRLRRLDDTGLGLLLLC